MPTSVDDPAAGREAAQRFGGKAAALFELQRAGFPVPETYCSPEDLEGVVARLGPPIAVRSSATVEDGREASFAGQFESYLDLGTPEEVRAAVERCRASVDAPAVREYCRKSGVPHGAVRMEVIVQRMVRPELAGVAFSVNPVTGAEEVAIEACDGLADALLAGRGAPLADDHPLLARHRPEIERTVRAVQRHFGAPQDVEFAVEDGRLYLLQARPITRIGFSPEVGEWTSADFREGGVASSVCTPLMWSLYRSVWRHALTGFLRDVKLLRGPDFEAVRLFFGRPYWNLGAVKRCLARLPGFVERELDEDLGVVPGYEGRGTVTPMTLGGLMRALPTALALPGVYRRQEAFARRFLDGGYEELAGPYEPLPADPRERFGDLVRDAYYRTELGYYRTIYCASIAKLEFCDAFPDADYPALVAGLPPLAHLEPTRVLRAMAERGERDVGPVLERFRHHSRRELDLSYPRWDEDRGFVEELLASFAGGAPGSPAGAVGEPGEEHRRARAAARAALPWRRRRAFDRKLERLRTFVWLREEMRDRSSRMYYLIRRYALAIAEREGLGDDVFFMTPDEILAGDRSAVERRREGYEGYRNFQPPPEIRSSRVGGAPAAEGPAPGGALQASARAPARSAARRGSRAPSRRRPGSSAARSWSAPSPTPAGRRSSTAWRGS